MRARASLLRRMLRASRRLPWKRPPASPHRVSEVEWAVTPKLAPVPQVAEEPLLWEQAPSVRAELEQVRVPEELADPERGAARAVLGLAARASAALADFVPM